MPKKLDKEKIQSELIAYISLQGATSSQSLCQLFKISQPSLSRIFSLIKDRLLIIGKAQETKYAICRNIEGVVTPIPIYEILEDASSRIFGILHPIKPQGFYFESKVSETKSALYPDLPYFLNDLRPTGFLGGLIPTQNEDLNLPNNILLWTADHCLRFLSTRGWNCIGNFILGEKAFQLYLQNCQSPKHGIAYEKRSEKYPQFADDILAMEEIGSSAGGEQPKFTTLLLPTYQHVIVKFSPSLATKIGRRVADLMICEHIALEIIKKNFFDAADSSILMLDNRVFLEIKRFDRLGHDKLAKFARRGLISLGSLDAEFVGTFGTWSKTSAELIKQKILPQSFFAIIRWRELFGGLIGNSDMHSYNLSFFTKGQYVTELAPVYDMLPMLFMPRNNQLVDKNFIPPLPMSEDGKIWQSAYKAACDFWDATLNDERISSSFKKIAQECKNKIIKLKDMAKLLPKN